MAVPERGRAEMAGAVDADEHITFREMFGRAMSGSQRAVPHRYQEQVASAGLPELLDVPTGAGKTAAVVLGWLWRRRFHPDPTVRASTPRWLVLCEPLRSLTEQTERAVAGWLEALSLGDGASADPVLVHVALGGREKPGERWRREPERDAVVIGTLDMLLSRALNRGYGSGRQSWPIDFGLLHSGTHWVFDEVQLMGVAAATSRQLQALRESFGTAQPTASTWMSATLDRSPGGPLDTVDNPVGEREVVIALDPSEVEGGSELARRMDGAKAVHRLDLDRRRPEADLAGLVTAAHRPGRRTLVVRNTVGRARALFDELRGRVDEGVDLVLVHSRFRPPERQDLLGRVLAEPGDGGTIVVATQVVEAGIDVSADALFTDLAPWSSIVQRAGRCNREGLVDDAALWWLPVDQRAAAPYDAGELEESARLLGQLEGQAVTPVDLARIKASTRHSRRTVLRRDDLLGMFDTLPDLSGDDIDVAPFIRDDPERDVLVAWRELDKEERPGDRWQPGSQELCRVPLDAESRAVLAGRAWRFDHLAGRWTRVRRDELRPGQVLVLAAGDGGYDPVLGWSPGSSAPVMPVGAVATEETPGLAGGEEAVEDDHLSIGAAEWTGLVQHLRDAEREVRSLIGCLPSPGLGEAELEAAAVAGRLHDIGKAHPVWQAALVAAAGDGEAAPGGGPWAKSPQPAVGRARPLRFADGRRGFRHELVSALALLDEDDGILRQVSQPRLVAYLVAAHHGRVRLGARSLVGGRDDGSTLLGVVDGDRIGPVSVPAEDGAVAELRPRELRLARLRLGETGEGTPSWTSLALDLLDRLGPFRLAYLEALVRVADWRASSRPGEGAVPPEVQR